MKQTLITIAILTVLSVVVVNASWGRLTNTDEDIKVGGARVYVIYDQLEHVNCYVAVSDQLAINENRSVSINCLPAK